MWVKTEDGNYVNDETGNVYLVRGQGTAHDIVLTTPLGGTINTTTIASAFASKEEAQDKLDELVSGFDIVQVHRDDDTERTSHK